MNERLKDALHKWLPRLAVVSFLLVLSSIVFLEFYVVPRKTAELKHREQLRHRFREEERERADEARAALERIVGIIDTIDGNQETQRALSEAVAIEKAIGEVWVTNAHGLIVYYGRYNPPIRNVADFPLGTLTDLLETVPDGLLSPIQRTAILLPAIIGGSVESWTSNFSQSRDKIPKHLIISADPNLRLASKRPVIITRVKDGLIAAAASRPQFKLGDATVDRLENIRPVRNITVAVFLTGSLILFWLTVPAWMALDAQKRNERAVAWGLFGLLGNIIAMVVYLLVRKNEKPTGNAH